MICPRRIVTSCPSPVAAMFVSPVSVSQRTHPGGSPPITCLVPPQMGFYRCGKGRRTEGDPRTSPAKPIKIRLRIRPECSPA